jgi:Domain of unknown function (DUF4349)
LSPDLLTALREETPAAPSALRDRVSLIAATPPPPRRTFTLRRIFVWAAPVTLATSCLVALVVGLGTALDAGQIDNENAARSLPVERNLERKYAQPQTDRVTGARDTGPLSPAQDLRRAVPAPSGGRAQDVQTDLRILVDDPNDLSTATQRALRTTRRLGGYLVTVNYGTPEPSEGTANLRVRIPVSRVQAAVVQFSGLGRILAQQTQIADLQQRLDEITRQIRRTKDKARIAALRRERTQLNRRAAYATVDLALTTHEPKEAAAAPSRFDRAVDDAVGVLTAELAIGAYILIVASPFLLLLGAAFAGSRAYRRYLDQRLLERA